MLDASALAMTCIAGLSTSVGGLFVIFAGAPAPEKLGVMLGFAAGVMIYISFMDLLVESTETIGRVYANLAFFSGMLFFHIVETVVPEPDIASVAVVTDPKKNDDAPANALTDAQLMKTALLTAVGVSIHNLPEGMCVYLACLDDVSKGIPMIIAIAVHNIPEGISVAAPIYHSTKSKWQTMKWTTMSGVCEPVGAALFGLLLKPFLTEAVVKGMLAAVGGIMVYVSLVELLPAAYKCSTKEGVSGWAAVGMFVIFGTLAYAHDYLGVHL